MRRVGRYRLVMNLTLGLLVAVLSVLPSYPRSQLAHGARALSLSAAPILAPGMWTLTGSMSVARYGATGTLLRDGRVLEAAGALEAGFGRNAELYNPRTGTWEPTGSMYSGREHARAVLLPNGKVLVAGGCTTAAEYCTSETAEAELYDPTTGKWSVTGAMAAMRASPTLVLLRTGKVLVAGGCFGTQCRTALSSAELYDPGTGTWTATGSMLVGRTNAAEVVLPDGRVLVAGGSRTGALSDAEIYDPDTGDWSPTGAMASARWNETLTLLANGEVLVDGGVGATVLNSAEIYNVEKGTWTPTGALATAREAHSATLLPNGRVLVLGGIGSGYAATLNSAELYDPSTGIWALAPAMSVARRVANTTVLENGTVLVAGGGSSSAELYTPATTPAPIPPPTGSTESCPPPWHCGDIGTPPTAGGQSLKGRVWTVRGSGTGTEYHYVWQALQADGGVSAHVISQNHQPPMAKAAAGVMLLSKADPSAPFYDAGVITLDGTPLVFVASRSVQGGVGAIFTSFSHATSVYLRVVRTGSVFTAYSSDDATTWQLIKGSAKTIAMESTTLAGMWVQSGDARGVSTAVFDQAKLYTPTTSGPSPAPAPASGTWTPTGSMTAARATNRAAVLADGRVLVVSGRGTGDTPVATADLYDPAAGTWSATAPMTADRYDALVTPLPDGRVLVAGGYSISRHADLSSAEVFDPRGSTWTATGPMAHLNALGGVLLKDGSVLVAGGCGDAACRARTRDAELYDAGSGTWTPTGPMVTARMGGRFGGSATLLADGRVLVAGGCGTRIGDGGCSSFLADAEMYNPASGTWAATGSMAMGRSDATATLLPSGDVLVAGGCLSHDVVSSYACTTPTNTAELYDPRTGRWAATASMSAARADFTATLLHNGLVLVAGGYNTCCGAVTNANASAELYDDRTGAWHPAAPMRTARYAHAAALLADGRVLVAGGANAVGSGGTGYFASAETYASGVTAAGCGGGGNNISLVPVSCQSPTPGPIVPPVGGSPAGSRICGTIPAKTSWTISGSPYILTCDVEVSKYVTLTIDPGVVIEGSGDVGLYVQGVLDARGTALRPITFRSGRAKPKAGDWTGLFFDGADASGSRLYYVSVFDAGRSYRKNGATGWGGWLCFKGPDAGGAGGQQCDNQGVLIRGTVPSFRQLALRDDGPPVLRDLSPPSAGCPYVRGQVTVVSSSLLALMPRARSSECSVPVQLRAAWIPGGDRHSSSPRPVWFSTCEHRATRLSADCYLGQ